MTGCVWILFFKPSCITPSWLMERLPCAIVDNVSSISSGGCWVIQGHAHSNSIFCFVADADFRNLLLRLTWGHGGRARTCQRYTEPIDRERAWK
ncbi:MAG: hypothetical protein LQ350_007140 [Teloschistes chrysophthalmus]|nr:MAG: hypothetical protein LQ350_007140 [Niorma chrysophthalma]